MVEQFLKLGITEVNFQLANVSRMRVVVNVLRAVSRVDHSTPLGDKRVGEF